MTRLPQPGSDQGTWGEILNDYLSQVHNTDGTLKDNVITSSALAPNAVDATVVASASITEDKLDSTVQAKLNAGSGGTVADATTTSKGLVQLAGDLSGTAASPTVPGLANKANTTDVYTKAQVDASLSAKADQSALTSGLAGKANTAHTHTASQISDSTVTGLALMTATDATAARTTIGAGTSNLTIGTTGTTAKVGDYAPTWGEVTGKPASFTPTAHTHTAADVTDFAEATQDVIGSSMVAGANVTVTYDDNAGTITVAATPSAGITDLSTTTTSTDVTVLSSTGNDAILAAATATDAGVMSAADKTKLTGIASGATANSSDAILLDRTNHTGVQAISTVTNLQTSLDAKAATVHTHVIADTTGLQTAIDGKAAAVHTHTASQISDSTVTGRAVVTATDAAAAQLALGIANTVQVVGSFAEVTAPVYGTLYVVRM